ITGVRKGVGRYFGPRAESAANRMAAMRRAAAAPSSEAGLGPITVAPASSTVQTATLARSAMLTSTNRMVLSRGSRQAGIIARCRPRRYQFGAVLGEFFRYDRLLVVAPRAAG